MAKKGELLFVSATVLFTWIILCIHLGLVKIVTLAQILNFGGLAIESETLTATKVWLPILNNLFKWFWCLFYFWQIRHHEFQYTVTIPIRARPSHDEKIPNMTLVQKVLPLGVKLWQLQKVSKSHSEIINPSEYICFLFLQIRHQQFLDIVTISVRTKPSCGEKIPY